MSVDMRIKALLLCDGGWTFEEISHVLLLDEKAIRRYRRWYEEEGSERLLNDDWGVCIVPPGDSGSQMKMHESSVINSNFTGHFHLRPE